MSVVEEIYRHNRIRQRPSGIERVRPVISLRGSIRKAESRRALGLIAEFKRQSPSGFQSDALKTPSDYFNSLPKPNISGISVLTEPTEFGGSWGDLMNASALDVPVLAKDFFDSETMIEDAYLCGADAILLIADFLDPGKLSDLSEFAYNLNMDALIEFHEVEAAEKIPVGRNVLVGYNRRNLRTMRMEGRENEVHGIFSKEKAPLILESGIDAANAGTMDFSHFSGLLIGSSIISGESVIDVLSGRNLL